MPVGVSVGIKMLEPWEICHAPLNSSSVCPIKMPSNDEPKSKSKARGADFRKAHTAVFKAKVIHCEPGVSQYHIGDKYGINQSQVSKWLKEKDNIIAAATQKHKKLF